jgi:hypothetical protein
MICLLVMTDGRRDCIEQTIPSAEANLHGPITSRIIFDDSGDPAYNEWLGRFPGWKIIRDGGRSGFGGAIRSAWAYLRTSTDEPFVFHLEDDFTFNRPARLTDMAAVLVKHPHLAQLALRRQPWNDAERAAGGIVEMWPEEYDEHQTRDGCAWLEHRLFFTTNPCLYRRPLLVEDWPTCKASERQFTHQLLNEGFDGVTGEDVRFAFWGGRASGEAVTHIGAERIGTGY